MNALKKFTPKFGTKADTKRMTKIHRAFDYAMEVDPSSTEELRRIRNEMDERRPRTLTRDEADFVIGACLEGGVRLKQQIKDLLYGYKPTPKPKSEWQAHLAKMKREARQQQKVKRAERLAGNNQLQINENYKSN